MIRRLCTGAALPPLYGVAWFEPWTNTHIVAMVPLNLVMRLGYWMRAALKGPRWLDVHKSCHEMYHRTYMNGWEDCESAQKKLHQEAFNSDRTETLQ